MGDGDGSGWIGTIDAVTKPVGRNVDRRHALLPALFLIVGVSDRRGFTSSGFHVVGVSRRGIGVVIRMTMMGLDRDHDFFHEEQPLS